MLKNENIICISSIDWDFIWQGHQEIMSTLAQDGNRVLFIENTGVRAPGIRDISRIRSRIKNWFKGVKGIRKEAENLYIFSPLVLPFPYSRLARWVNRRLVLSVLERWARAVDFSDPVIWSFLPTPLSRDIADAMTSKLVVYYCIDNFSASSGAARKIKVSEAAFLKKADLVFVTSAALYDYCHAYNDQVYLFPFGVSYKKFEAARLGPNAVPDQLKGIRHPIIGYVGGIHRWIDQRLIKAAASRHPDYSFALIGPVQTDVSALSGTANIHFLGNQDHHLLPVLIRGCDVCIIPYVVTEYTRNVYPTKLNEYLAMGKPVVSTALPEALRFNQQYGQTVYIGRDADTFSQCLQRALQPQGGSGVQHYLRVARDNAWEARIEKMSELIMRYAENKKARAQMRWKDTLLAFYRTARRRTLRYGALTAAVYFLLFQTPLLWFVASPLKISEAPRRADTIVVFGGGVGEGGSPGKSTIERARYAAELYRNGYATKIIFSAGYTYTFNDAENMKLIAVSAGVPERDIILEQKGDRTYENVLFTKEILDKNRYRSILLVSSPYHMRRVSLVFRRWGKDIKVIYVPIEKPQFYDRSEGVRLTQIAAIVHEYVGIVYYRLKGYL